MQPLIIKNSTNIGLITFTNLNNMPYIPHNDNEWKIPTWEKIIILIGSIFILCHL